MDVRVVGSLRGVFQQSQKGVPDQERRWAHPVLLQCLLASCLGLPPGARHSLGPKTLEPIKRRTEACTKGRGRPRGTVLGTIRRSVPRHTRRDQRSALVVVLHACSRARTVRLFLILIIVVTGSHVNDSIVRHFDVYFSSKRESEKGKKEGKRGLLGKKTND